MAAEIDPYAPPASEPLPVVEPFTLNLPDAVRLLAMILFPLSAVGAAVISLGISGNVLEALLTGLVYGIGALVAGFIPMLAGAYFYIRLHAAGKGSLLAALLVALGVVALAVAVFFILTGASQTQFLIGVVFCYLHAFPTALIAHRIVQQRLDAAQRSLKADAAGQGA